MKRQLLICEMSPRDGLQFIGRGRGATIVPVEMKLHLISALARAGLPYIEVGAFVRSQVAQQMANTPELANLLEPIEGVQLAALVPNAIGYAAFAKTRLDTVALFVSASERHSRSNVNRSVAESLAEACSVATLARKDGKRLRAHLSSAFHDIGYEARPSNLKDVLSITGRLLDAGVECVALADTSGDAHPQQVEEVLLRVGEQLDISRVAVHLHDRLGRAMANAWTAYNAGVRIFDAAVGGIGGSELIPSSTLARKPNLAGNIATEQLALMFEDHGVHTGIDLSGLFAAGRIVYDITRLTGDFAPPSHLLREELGYGLDWVDASENSAKQQHHGRAVLRKSRGETKVAVRP